MKTYSLHTCDVLTRYDYLARLSADRWAWEYLRRNPEFRKDATLHSEEEISERAGSLHQHQDGHQARLLRPQTEQKLAERWGLVFMPSPDKTAIDADAVWLKQAYPDQIEINGTPRRAGETCTIAAQTVAICNVTHVTDAAAREYLLLRRNANVVQIHCTGMSLLGIEPVRMKLQIANLHDLNRKMRIQKEALKLLDTDAASAEPQWSKRTHILRDGLIALDCLELGMTRREIATTLYGPDIVRRDWSQSLKDQLRYRVKKATDLRDGGYLKDLLGARIASNDAVAPQAAASDIADIESSMQI